jgi:hypothetical protein
MSETKKVNTEANVKTEESTLSLFQKLAKIRGMVEALQKNKSGYGYKYVSEDEILAKVTAGLKKYNLDVYPKIIPGTITVTPYATKKTKVGKTGNIFEENVNEVIISSEMEFEWINLDNPTERYSIPWVIAGQQSDVSQALGSGLTYCTRYFFLKFFKSSTLESDPDSWRGKQENALNEENIAITKEIIKDIDKLIKENITDDRRTALADLIKKYVKKNGKASPDYLSVTEPVVASELLKAVSEFFGKSTKKEERD